MKKPIKPLVKLLFTFFVVAMSSFVVALGCDDGGTPDIRPEVISDDLKITGRNITYTDDVSGKRKIVVLSDETNNILYVNAKVAGEWMVATSSTKDEERGFADVVEANRGATKLTRALILFDISYPTKSRLETSKDIFLPFVLRSNVTRDTISLPKAINVPYFKDDPRPSYHEVRTIPCVNSSESADNTLAKLDGGGFCRTHSEYYKEVSNDSYLGTVFNNKDKTKARGTMRCGSSFGASQVGPAIDDDTTNFISSRIGPYCALAAINDGLGKDVKIDEAWVKDPNSTTEVELYALSIKIAENSKIPQFSTDPAFNLKKFLGELTNADMKKILAKNDWRELKFKVKFVTDAEFNKLFTHTVTVSN